MIDLQEKKNKTERKLLTVANCKKDVCFAGLRDCFGELEIKVKSIRELGLEIIDDSEELNIPYHASILNLPAHEGDTFAQTEFLAGELAKKVIRINDRPKI